MAIQKPQIGIITEILMQIIDCISLYHGCSQKRFKDWIFFLHKTHLTFKIASPNVKIKATIQYNLVTANTLKMDSHFQRSQFHPVLKFTV